LLGDLTTEKQEQRAQVVEPGAADRKGEEGFRALYTMNRDGTNVEYLVAAPGMISSSSPEWSHDGAMIAFDGVPEVGELGKARLFVYALKGPFKGMFRDFGCGNVPSWSPDDQRIAYMVNAGNPSGVEDGIWIMDADGSNRKRICRGWYPRWSPDGKRLHVYAYFDQPASIHIIDLETRKNRKLPGESMDVAFGGGTWSPDSNRLVFIGRRDREQHLAVVNADGDPESIRILYTEKSEGRELIGPPAWSPDGEQIVFAVQENDAEGSGNRRWAHSYLYSISAKVPSAPVLLEPGKKGLVNRSPMWSPDSSTIVFSSER
jgi:Tol biopolymer transport system component